MTDKQLNFSGQVFLVTGAANGIGKALALSLSRHGADVILLDKDENGLNTVYDEITAESRTQAVIVQQDLCQLTQEHCAVLSEQIEQSFGKLDGLIHCAAETGQLAPIEHYNDKDWHKIINANLNAVYLLSKGLLTLLNLSANGKIIFTLSDQAQQASAFWGAFAVAQQGLKALIDSWRDESESTEPQLIMLNPGKVNTEFLTKVYPGLYAQDYPAAGAIAPAYLNVLASAENLSGKIIAVDELS